MDAWVAICFTCSCPVSPRTTHWRHYLFSILYSGLLCYRLVGNRCISLFLGSLLCSLMCVCVCECHTILITVAFSIVWSLGEFFFPPQDCYSKQHSLTCMLISLTAAAKSLQSCLTLWDSIGSSPPGSPNLRILQARILEWVAVSISSIPY